MSMKKFVKCCKTGGFIDYDGSGNYMVGEQMTNISVYPSDIKAKQFRKEFDKVIWFNR